MNYFRFALDQPRRTHFSEFAPPPEVRDDAWLDFHLGRPSSLSQPLTFTRVIRGGGRPEPLKDLLYATMAPLLVSRRLLKVFEPFLPQVQVLDARIEFKGRVESFEFACLNVLAVAECFDFLHSKFSFRVTDEQGGSREVRYVNPLTRWYVRWRFREHLAPGCKVGYVYEPILRREAIPSELQLFRVRGIEGQFLFVSEALKDAALASGCIGLAFRQVAVV